MIDDALLTKFLGQFDNLKEVVAASSARSIKDPPDSLFYDHQNVFIKSYLVSACSMLEAFIQDLAGAYVDKLQAKINSANLPFNLVVWIVEHEKAKLEFKAFEAKKSKKDISDLVSPNYWKTMQAFQRVASTCPHPTFRTTRISSLQQWKRGTRSFIIMMTHSM